MNRIARAFVALLVVALAAVMTTACAKGSGIGPDPTPTPTTATLNIVYQRPASLSCKFGGCETPPNAQITGPDGTNYSVKLVDNGSGKFAGSITVPLAPAPTVRTPFTIMSNDTWAALNDSGSRDSVGEGFTINGVQLTDVSGAIPEQWAKFWVDSGSTIYNSQS